MMDPEKFQEIWPRALSDRRAWVILGAGIAAALGGGALVLGKIGGEVGADVGAVALGVGAILVLWAAATLSAGRNQGPR